MTTGASRATLIRRAAALDTLREFFRARGVLEVDTPILRPYASMEPHLASFQATWQARIAGPSTRYLHTSPEYAMKILLARHGLSLFQLARVFRDEPRSPTHHPEFTMLEWYRVGFDEHALMDETEALVRTLARHHALTYPTLRWHDHIVDLAQPFERLSVHDAFVRYANIDLVACPDAPSLAHAARASGCDVGEDWGWDDIFHLILLERVEAHLGHGRATFLFDYPARLAALARLRERPGHEPVAARFELYMAGLELCNGFWELTDSQEQRRRFEIEQGQRVALGRPPHALDEDLLKALESMPACAGNALGMDRFLMLLFGLDHIEDVISLAYA